MINYYELLGLPEQYFLDTQKLRLAYLDAARQAHPDHQAENPEANDQTALLNTAYETLKDPHLRLQYLLQLYDLLDEAGGSKQSLPPDFLMEMMEMNETLDELKYTPDADVEARCRATIAAYEEKLANRLSELMQVYDQAPSTQRRQALSPMVEVFLQQRYVLRLAESLRNFAA